IPAHSRSTILRATPLLEPHSWVRSDWIGGSAVSPSTPRPMTQALASSCRQWLGLAGGGPATPIAGFLGARHPNNRFCRRRMPEAAEEEGPSDSWMRTTFAAPRDFDPAYDR